MNRADRNRQMLEFFAQRAADYDAVHLLMMDNKRAITQALLGSPRCILDLGVGTGLELIPLFERFPEAHVTGIDLAQPMLDELKKRGFASRVTVQRGDFFEVPFGEGYDAAISSAALHHFTEADKALLYAKVFCALKPGGQWINTDRFAATQQEQDAGFCAYALNPNAQPHMDTPLTLDNEYRLLSDAGFCSIEILPLKDPRYRLMTAVKPR